MSLYKKIPSPKGRGFFANVICGLCFVGEFRSLLDHVATAITNLGRIESGLDRSNSFGGGRSDNRGDFGCRSSGSFNRNARSQRATGFGGRSSFLSRGGSSGCGGLSISCRSSIIEFTARTIVAVTAFTTRATVIALFIAVAVLGGLSLLVAAIILVLAILAMILIVVTVTALSHFLGTDGAAGIRLQVHVRGELFNNRSMEIVENLVNLR